MKSFKISRWCSWLGLSLVAHAITLAGLPQVTSDAKPEYDLEQGKQRIQATLVTIPAPQNTATPLAPLPASQPATVDAANGATTVCEAEPTQPQTQPRQITQPAPDLDAEPVESLKAAATPPAPEPEPPAKNQEPTLPEQQTAESEDLPLEPQNILAETLPSPIAAPAAPAGQLQESGPAARINPPPHYPRAAILRNLTGDVWLRVVLAPDGTPQTVEVARSSGHAILDSSARHTVAKRWQFMPPTQEATALVRIQFALQ